MRASWDYRDESGKPIGLKAVRYDDGTDKVVIPYRLNGSGHWKAGAAPEPRPLFGLQTLAPARERGGSLVIVEGEKCAAALHSLGFAAVTSQGGAGAAGKADWTPCSGFARVYVLPDNNAAGRRYAADVCAALGALESPPELFIVDLPGLPPAGDVVDWLRTRLPDWDGFTSIDAELVSGLMDEFKRAIRRHATAPPDEWTGGEAWPEPIPLESAPLPPWPDPLRIFPDPIGEFVAGLSESTETPPELATLMTLAALATACRGRYWVKVHEGYREPLGLFVVGTAPPGSRKTAIVVDVTAALASWERQQRAELAETIKRTASEHATLSARIGKLRQQAAGTDGPEFKQRMGEIADLEAELPETPTLPQVFTDDITPENLGTLMGQNDEAMGLLSDEAGIFGIMSGRYSQGGQANLDVFLKGHAGAPVRVNRGSRPPVLMNKPVLSLGLLVQPDALQGLTVTREFRGRGLLGRFLYVVPPSNLGRRSLDAPPLSDDLRLRYEGRVHALLNREPDTDGQGEPRPHVLTLEPEAFKAWKALQRRIEPEMDEGGRFEHLTDWASKLAGAAARIAAILHCARHAITGPENRPVALVDMQAAITLAGALEAHALAAFDAMGADPDLDDARAVLRWLVAERRDTFTFRDCQRRHQSRFPRADDLCPAIELLEERGYIRQQQPTGPASRGRPARVYDVNPVCWEGGVQ